MKLILASASPRRAEILRNAGFRFDVLAVDADETLLANEDAKSYVQRLADTKAQLASERVDRMGGPQIVIGADTTVVAEGQILGKPEDEEDARRMLRLLSGRTHEVVTGVAALRVDDGVKELAAESTLVSFLALSESEIDRYVASREPFGKAGGYGIQGIGGRYIWRVEGCYFNVMGLPVSKLWRMLGGLGWKERFEPVARG